MIDKDTISTAKDAAKKIFRANHIKASLGIQFTTEGYKLAVRVQGRRPFLDPIMRKLDDWRIYPYDFNAISVPWTSRGRRKLMDEVRVMLSSPEVPDVLKNIPKDIKFIGVPRAG